MGTASNMGFAGHSSYGGTVRENDEAQAIDLHARDPSMRTPAGSYRDRISAIVDRCTPLHRRCTAPAFDSKVTVRE
jgi:hypothetical protein